MMKGLKTFGCLLALLLAAVILFPATAKAADVAINSTNFPDENFRALVEDEEIDTNQDGKLSAAEIKAVQELYVWSSEIVSLKGVEFFTNLRELYCANNKIKKLDVLSSLNKLEILDCSENKLTKLDVSNMAFLERLNCSDNILTSLNVTKNTALKRLVYFENEITSLDVSKNTKLELLNCEDNELTTLVVTKNPELRAIVCGENEITALNVTKNPELLILRCEENKLSKLDLSQNPKMHILTCYDNSIKTLDIHLSTRLTWAYVKPEEEFQYEEDARTDYVYYDYHAPMEYYYLDEDEDIGDMGLECRLGVNDATKIYCKPKVTTPAKTTTKKVSTGDKVSLKAVAKSAVDVTYQWYYKTSSTGSYKKVTAAAGKKATYTFTAQDKHNGYIYLCRATNKYGYTNSKTYKLKVIPLPEITSPTAASTKTVKKGKTATFKVVATGAASYQWQYRTSKTGAWKTVAAASGKTATYKLYTAAAKHNGYQYRCKVMNSAGGAVYSKIVTLKVTS